MVNPTKPMTDPGQTAKVRPGVEVGSLSDPGCERPDNQDNYCYAEPESDEQFAKKGRLAVVADGMGGYEGGALASGIAVEVIRSKYLNSELNAPEDALVDALVSAHVAIRNAARESPEDSRMGTTCTAAVLHNNQLFYVHVGDSRLYMVRDSQISRVTRDQTMIEKLVEEGILTREQAKTHPDRHVLMSALGVGEEVPAELPENPIPLHDGDILLLCSDGLHDLVSDEEILQAVLQDIPEAACHKLVDQAKARGGYDNITVQIVKIHPR
jgi:protein phosphatase